VAISQDMAVVATIGKLLTNTMSFPFCYDTELATNLASRERSQVSVPLFRATIQMNRSANTLRPGSVFKFSWPEYNINSLIMRVQRFDLGELVDGRIVVEAIQDSFAVSDTVFANQPPSSWVNVEVLPTDIVASRIVQMPRFFISKLEFPIPATNLGFVPLAAQPGTASNFYDALIFNNGAGDTVDDALREPEFVPYEASGLLTTEYDQFTGWLTGKDTTVGIVLNNVLGDELFATSLTDPEIHDEYSGIIIMGDEWMAYGTATDNGSGNWTLTNIQRGLFGTTIETHAVSTRLYTIPVEAFGFGNLSTLAKNVQFTTRLLDTAGGSRQANDEGAAVLTTFTDNLNELPVHPTDLQLDGTRALNHIVGDQVARNITWSPRQAEVLAAAFDGDAAETPDEVENYLIDVYVGGVLNATLSGTVADSVLTYSIPFNLTSINEADVQARVFARTSAGSLVSLGYGIYPFELSQFLPGTALSITNADAETGDVTGWTSSVGTMTVRATTPNPHAGSWYFYAGAFATTESYQDVAVPVGEETNIDAGTALIYLEWYQTSFAGSDEANIKLEFFDNVMTSLGTNAGPGLVASSSAQWNLRQISGVSVPVDTRTVRITLEFNRVAGGNSDGYIDTIAGSIA